MVCDYVRFRDEVGVLLLWWNCLGRGLGVGCRVWIMCIYVLVFLNMVGLLVRVVMW